MSSRKRIFNTTIFLLGVTVIIMITYFLRASYSTLAPGDTVTLTSTTGGWTVEKSAEWIEEGKARITLDLSTTAQYETNTNKYDVILMIDASGSMNSSNKLTNAKADAIEFATNILSDSSNKVALIKCGSSEAAHVSDLTNNLSTITTGINGLTASGGTNYYRAFSSLQNMLSHYTSSDSRDLVVYFLTDGLGKTDDGAKANYEIVKDLYPNMKIIGIQYNMGSTIKPALTEITDEQWSSTSTQTENIFKNVRRSDVISYDTLTITDVIDTTYFENITNLTASYGTSSLSNNTVTWDLADLPSGDNATLTIDMELHKYGDVNLDGVVNSTDATIMTNYLANHSDYIHYFDNEPIKQRNADVDLSGDITQVDKLIISRHVSGMEGYETLPKTNSTVLFPTNTSLSGTSSINNTSDTQSTNVTPVLKDAYTVTYDIVVDSVGNITVTNNTTTTDSDGYTVLQVLNARLNILPNTGGPGTRVYTIVGFLLMVSSLIGLAIYTGSFKKLEFDIE